MTQITFASILLERNPNQSVLYKLHDREIIMAKNQTFPTQIGWDIFLHHIWLKFGWVYDVINWLICIF